MIAIRNSGFIAAVRTQMEEAYCKFRFVRKAAPI